MLRARKGGLIREHFPMGLHYPTQEAFYALGVAATPVTLTTAYSGNVSGLFNMAHYSQITLCVDYTPGAGGGGNSVQIKIEGSPDPLNNDGLTVTDFYQETSSGTSGGTITHYAAEHTFVGTVASTQYKIFFYVPPAFLTFRVSAKETVVGGAAGVLKVRAITSGK